ncbi:DNA replication complex GINS protein PSF3 [Cladophialophora psammophila CBS 110553]|uniref:DNA replication complex GINS protein PSF3 n=1 Tax=Cladophialophora psammophila CBS 110553 TaxID=1182543 RepID=W9VY56_9EURO|nr:DNA replication complex GINS protein PSF3 [Cladophialophora psammophila CBS 110553]EXJ57655.1 DNA replication complex GINS protein PSF3 [Cladophialophora psammophila CBS 110553]
MSSYYDVDAILTDSQKLPCTFELDVPGLGYIEGNAGGTVKAGTKVDLPMWLGVMLAVSTGNTPGSPQLVTLDFPAPLQQRVINALKADPKTVDLRAQAPHFYALGARIMELFDDRAVLDTLLDTFKERAAEIADQAHNPRGVLGEGAEFLRGLDESERQLFKAAHEGPKAVRAWTQDLRKNT